MSDTDNVFWCVCTTDDSEEWEYEIVGACIVSATEREGAHLLSEGLVMQTDDAETIWYPPSRILRLEVRDDDDA